VNYHNLRIEGLLYSLKYNYGLVRVWVVIKNMVCTNTQIVYNRRLTSERRKIVNSISQGYETAKKRTLKETV
jgi:hypothetical protein